jgi:outer membrane protein TolC
VKNQPKYRASTTLNALEKAALDQQVLLLSHRVHRAWIEAVAALISANQLQQVWEAAQVSAELAQRMVQVGNWSKVQAAQALLTQAGAAQQLAMARLQAFSARERLVRVLGVSGPDAQFTLVPSLPKLPVNALGLKGIEEVEDLALRNSPALALARTTAARESAGVSASDLLAWPLAVAADLQDWPSPETKAGADVNTPALSPLPTQAPVRQRRVPASTHELDNAALANRQAQRLEADIRSLAREAYFRYRTAFELAKHQRDTVLVLQTLQQDETQVRYNGMLQSTWDLLASAQVRLQSVNTAQLAERDFWLAHTDLQAVLAGAVVSFSGEASPAGQVTNAAQGH